MQLRKYIVFTIGLGDCIPSPWKGPALYCAHTRIHTFHKQLLVVGKQSVMNIFVPPPKMCSKGITGLLQWSGEAGFWWTVT